MRTFIPSIMIGLLTVAGCGSAIHDHYPEGWIDKDLYKEAVMDNQQCLAGEDHRIQPLYRTPTQAVGAGFHDLFIHPMDSFFDWLGHATPGVAVRKMLDPDSADNRREGTLRMTDFAYARTGATVKFYARVADDRDYVVRAAGLRALNRCRARGHSGLFLKYLDDDEPLVRLQAADALSNIPDPSTVHALIEHMRSDISGDVKIACAEALRNFKDAQVASALVDVLDDKNFAVAWQARQSLALITGQDFRYDKKAWLNYFSAHPAG
ncbi:MAG: HEAT repeat domain-containing protein [Tepidisphaeraceae bacterium]|jgi:hypothetical protein